VAAEGPCRIGTGTGCLAPGTWLPHCLQRPNISVSVEWAVEDIRLVLVPPQPGSCALGGYGWLPISLFGSSFVFGSPFARIASGAYAFRLVHTCPATASADMSRFGHTES